LIFTFKLLSRQNKQVYLFLCEECKNYEEKGKIKEASQEKLGNKRRKLSLLKKNKKIKY